MYGIGETCIIHSVSDYSFAMYVKEFMKWIGVSFFDFTYNEIEKNLNEELKRNHFDFILYINDKENRWKEQYKELSDVHVDIQPSSYSDSIWKAKAPDRTELVCNEEILIHVFHAIISRLLQDDENTKVIFTKLAEIYCNNDVLHKMLDNKYGLLQNFKETFCIQDFYGEIDRQCAEWESIIKQLEDGMQERITIPGSEHYTYAYVYSKRKRMELLEILHWKSIDTIEGLLDELDSIYEYNPDFYMGESLKAKVSSMDINSQIMSVFYMADCVKICPTDACNSFHYYRMGRFCEQLGRQEDAWPVYENAYKKNRLNFRALFKLAVNKINTEKYGEAEDYLVLILKILQVYHPKEGFIEENVKDLPVLEMEYVCKTFLLLELADNRKRESWNSKGNYYDMAMKVHDLVEDSRYLKKMYPNDYEVIKSRVKSRLSEQVIQKKLRKMSGMRY